MLALEKAGGNQLASSLVESEFNSAQNALVASTTIRRFKSGETLFVEGESAPYCFQVMSGIVKEYNTLIDGRRQIADFYTVGEVFGLSEISEYVHTAEAITECAIRCYPRDYYLRTISASPQLSQQLLDSLMTRLHRSRERAIMLGRMTAVQRVAAFLLRLSSDQGHSENVQIFMSRQDIADHLGLTIETVCRALTELKRIGAISMRTARRFSVPSLDLLDDIGHGSETLH